MSSGLGQAYTVCFNTANRDQGVYPQPNVFEMPLTDGSSNMPPVSAIQLGSVELPACTQWTIEGNRTENGSFVPGWATLPYDQGISTAINVSPAEDENQLFTLDITPSTGAPTTTVTAAVPPTLNPATIAVAGTTATVTTTFPHGLVAGRSGWSRVSLEGTTLQDETAQNLSTNPTVTITSATTFTMTTVAGAPAAGAGYLLSLDPNPLQLAAGLTAALNAELVAAFVDNTPVARVTYSTSSNLFTLQLSNGRLDLLARLTHAAVSLPTKMGFGQGALLTLASAATTFFTVTGNYAASTCPGTLVLRPGNYTPATFAAEFERAWNPFVFNGGCGAVLADRENFAFSNAAGACFQIPIDYGTYTPTSFAAYLQAEMIAADGTQPYTVTYDAGTGAFTIASTMPLGLPLDDVLVTPRLVHRMGFDRVCYNGALSYTGASVGYTPGQCSSVPQFRSGNLRVLWHEEQCRFTLRFCGTPCQTDVIVVAAGQGTVGPLPDAHGLSVGDFVALTATTGAASVLPVVAVPDAFTFVVDMYGSAIANGNTVAVCDWASNNASLNLYFQSVPTLADIMGFPALSVFSGSDGELVAPNAHNFDGPPYLLWVISEPSGSAFIRHAWRGSTRADVFAKLIMRNNTYAIERLYPMQKIVQGNHRMTRLVMAVYNPDHTPYNFHGKNWSGTLTFTTASTAGALLAY